MPLDALRLHSEQSHAHSRHLCPDADVPGWSDALQGRWPPTEASWRRSRWVRAVRAARQVHVAGASTSSAPAGPPPSSR